jgi:hypothetical protein
MTRLTLLNLFTRWFLPGDKGLMTSMTALFLSSIQAVAPSTISRINNVASEFASGY